MKRPRAPSPSLHHPLSWREAMWFPLRDPAARRDLVIGGFWLLVPGIGWILNMGHRVVVTHRLLHGRAPWPAWQHHGELFRHGLYTFAGMVIYHLPAMGVLTLAWWWSQAWLGVVAAVLWLAATLAIPGYMTHYSHSLRVQEIFNPSRAMRRVWQSGWGYWRAWGIALGAMALSFLGLLALGLGFLWTSVWFWQVAAYGFASVVAQRHGLGQPPASDALT